MAESPLRPGPLAVPPAVARALCVAGAALAFLLLAIPVRATITGDPLLRLRLLDPELAPLRADVSCGQPLGALDARAGGPTFTEVARADACRDAAQRRVAVAVAVGGLLVVAGLVGLHGGRPRPALEIAPGRAMAATRGAET